MLAITNPAGSLAVFLGMTESKTPKERRQIACVAALTVFVVLIIITWIGIPFLTSFGISLPAFEITGGLIILLRSLEMLNAKENPTSRTADELEEAKNSVAVVPLGIPIIAGPGAMTNVIIFTQDFPDIVYRLYICFGILLISCILGIVLLFADRIGQLIGQNGIKITTKIMGLVLAAIAMSMIMAGLKSTFPGWS